MTKNVAKVLAGVSQHFNFSVQQEPSSSEPTLAGSSKTSPATVSELNNQASQATQTKTRDTLLTLFKSQSLTSSSKVDAPNKESINFKGQDIQLDEAFTAELTTIQFSANDGEKMTVNVNPRIVNETIKSLQSDDTKILDDICETLELDKPSSDENKQKWLENNLSLKDLKEFIIIKNSMNYSLEREESRPALNAKVTAANVINEDVHNENQKLLDTLGVKVDYMKAPVKTVQSAGTKINTKDTKERKAVNQLFISGKSQKTDIKAEDTVDTFKDLVRCSTIVSDKKDMDTIVNGLEKNGYKIVKDGGKRMSQPTGAGLYVDRNIVYNRAFSKEEKDSINSQAKENAITEANVYYEKITGNDETLIRDQNIQDLSKKNSILILDTKTGKSKTVTLQGKSNDEIKSTLNSLSTSDLIASNLITKRQPKLEKVLEDGMSVEMQLHLDGMNDHKNPDQMKDSQGQSLSRFTSSKEGNPTFKAKAYVIDHFNKKFNSAVTEKKLLSASNPQDKKRETLITHYQNQLDETIRALPGDGEIMSYHKVYENQKDDDNLTDTQRAETKSANKIYSLMSAIIQLNAGSDSDMVSNSLQKYQDQGLLPEELNAKLSE